MAARAYRVQILLKPDLHRRLRQIAEREKRSISEVSRDLLEYALQQRERAVSARLERVRAAHEVAQKILQERDGRPIEVDVADLLRQEREG
ncbi:MAG: hypothetical protein Kow0047_21820 [Anaerolineae bacterium]